MGHYDECREGYCPECGQTWGNCVHTNKDLKALQEAKENCRYIITSEQFNKLCRYFDNLRSLRLPPSISDNTAPDIFREIRKQPYSEEICPKECPQLEAMLRAVKEILQDKSLTHPCSHGLRICCEFCSIPCNDRRGEKIP